MLLNWPLPDHLWIGTKWRHVLLPQRVTNARASIPAETAAQTRIVSKARADYPVKPVMLVAGDDAARKPGVMELVGKLGFEPVDAGPLKNARLLEPFAMVWIDQAMKRGRGRDFAFALVSMR